MKFTLKFLLFILSATFALCMFDCDLYYVNSFRPNLDIQHEIINFLDGPQSKCVLLSFSNREDVTQLGKFQYKFHHDFVKVVFILYPNSDHDIHHSLYNPAGFSRNSVFVFLNNDEIRYHDFQKIVSFYTAQIYSISNTKNIWSLVKICQLCLQNYPDHTFLHQDLSSLVNSIVLKHSVEFRSNQKPDKLNWNLKPIGIHGYLEKFCTDQAYLRKPFSCEPNYRFFETAQAYYNFSIELIDWDTKWDFFTSRKSPRYAFIYLRSD